MRVPPVDWAALLPVIAPVAALLLVLLLDAAAPVSMRQHGLKTWFDGATLAGLSVSAGAVVWLAGDGVGGARGDVATFCSGGPSTGPEVSEFVVPDCAYVASQLTLTLQGVVLAAALVTLLLTLHGPGATDRVAHHVLFLTAVTGGLALAGSRDLISLLVSLELASLPAVALVALRRDARGAQGALTFLLTAIGSLGLLALGAGLLLLATGSLYLQRISLVLGVPASGPARAVAALGVLLALAGLGYKLSAVPFHLWTPDTYAGAPLPIAAFLSVVSKAAGLAAVVVLLGAGAAPLAQVWAPAIGVVAALTMTVGNVMALRQRIAVRLLAWSTVAQAGWVLLPLAAAGTRVSVAGGAASGTRQAVAASVGYLVAYTAAGLAAFAVVVVFARHVAAGEGHAIEDYRGLARREPVAAAVLGFALLCLAGLPPGVMGLVAKLVAVRPVVDAGAWVIAVVAAVNVALGVAYYLRWGALLVAARTEGSAAPTWRLRPVEGLALGAGAAACLAFSVFPDVVAAVLPGPLG